MGNHDVSVDSYGENIEDRDTQQTVAKKRIELTQLRTPDPVSREKLGSCQGKIEATEEEIRHGEVDDKYGSCVADLESFQSKTRSLIMCLMAGTDWDTFLQRRSARMVMMLPGRPQTRNMMQHMKADINIQSG